jgi:hypothetical protein
MKKISLPGKRLVLALDTIRVLSINKLPLIGGGHTPIQSNDCSVDPTCTKPQG